MGALTGILRQNESEAKGIAKGTWRISRTALEKKYKNKSTLKKQPTMYALKPGDMKGRFFFKNEKKKRQLPHLMEGVYSGNTTV